MIRHLFLASQSPRRLELLRQIGIEPTVLPLRVAPGRLDVDETSVSGETATAYVMRVARTKLEAGVSAQRGRTLPPWPILAADTTVTLDGAIIGKPANVREASVMLQGYSGRSHTVLTAIAASHQGCAQFALSESVVTFKSLSAEEIAVYVETAECLGKAGGYAIQGRAAMFVQHLAGSHSGVMGLPLYETAELLKAVGFELP